jgi:hypothetical protein
VSLRVDPAALDRIATTLSEAGYALDESGSTTPGSVDAGAATPTVLGIMARLLEDSGQLAVALAGAGEAVAASSAAYRAQELATADSLSLQVWGDAE